MSGKVDDIVSSLLSADMVILTIHPAVIVYSIAVLVFMLHDLGYLLKVVYNGTILRSTRHPGYRI